MLPFKYLGAACLGRSNGLIVRPRLSHAWDPPFVCRPSAILTKYPAPSLSCHLPSETHSQLLFHYENIWLQNISEPVILLLWGPRMTYAGSPWASSHVWAPMLCPPSWFLPWSKTLSEHQAEMPGTEWQKDCVITSQEFVVRHPFIRAWNVGKQREVLKKKVMCLIKQQNIKVKGTQYRRAEGPRDRRLEDV